MEIVQIFLISLLVTVFLEAIFIYGCMKVLKQQRKFFFVCCISAFASGFTLPYVWFVFPVLFGFGFIYGEIFAVIVESVLYYYTLKLPFYQAFIYSLGANIFSFFLGKYILEFIISH